MVSCCYREPFGIKDAPVYVLYKVIVANNGLIDLIHQFFCFCVEQSQEH